ncbi:MAG: phage tail terminator-like protein [Magnetospiraceae bacterium]
MSFRSDAETLVGKFVTDFTAAHPDISIAHDNVDFDPQGAAFVRVTVVPGQSALVAMPGRYRNRGLLAVQIHSPRGQGAGAALGIADDIAGFFRGFRSGDLLCRAPAVSRVGEDDAFYRVAVAIPYQSDIIV